MTGATKIMLSDFELAKVLDSEWILTKKRIMDKAAELFNQQVAVINKAWEPFRHKVPGELEAVVPRIYKGEQYRGLPYVILDYPSVFGKENVFAIRTMFWWGNFISISLQASGKYRELFAPSIMNALLRGQEELFVCINDDQWEHHFEKDNYVPAGQMDGAQHLLLGKPFIKLALKYDLKEWNQMPQLLEMGYQHLFSLLDR